ncbi:hypothetical protein LVJ94_22420 [Pendulispora rubella]|uniref:Uncharacterized protein n=1 Tax=Pendulispora rubella TaxID=2741070 RepID=A0ABZ2LHX3_9BACT
MTTPNITVVLDTPPLPRCVPQRIFDDFGWCASDTLEWTRPRARPFDLSTPLDGTDPARMVFVFHRAFLGRLDGREDFLPRELAKLHAFGMGLSDDAGNEDWALAPYAIDDATDELWARRIRPRDVLWLAADNMNALFWGLHDWSHFHNHGRFDVGERAWTELQCDQAALFWMWINRRAIGLDEPAWLRMHADVIQGALARFKAEGAHVEGADREYLARCTPDALLGLVP